MQTKFMNRTTIASLVLTGLCASAFAGTNYTYLALGDSIPFGMNITLVPPYSSAVPMPSDFIGYPEIVAAGAHVTELNASCPGETSGSFLNTSAPDNGCNSVHMEVSTDPMKYPTITLPPIKTSIGLHTPYTIAQMDFAVAQLTTNKNIDLVTLNIGANDILLALPALEACGTDNTCAQNVLGPVLQNCAANLGAILTGIRGVYQGTLVLMTYYSPAPALDSVTEALNSTLTQVAAALSAKPGFAPITIADGFTAFQQASAKFGGDACKAGLLIPLPPSPYDLSACDIHPSAAGRTLLADLIEFPATGTSCNGAFFGTFVGNVKVSAGQTCMFVGGGVTGNITQTAIV
jgi:lysophospholipase L1-like esterase